VSIQHNSHVINMMKYKHCMFIVKANLNNKALSCNSSTVISSTFSDFAAIICWCKCGFVAVNSQWQLSATRNDPNVRPCLFICRHTASFTLFFQMLAGISQAA